MIEQPRAKFVLRNSTETKNVGSDDSILSEELYEESSQVQSGLSKCSRLLPMLRNTLEDCICWPVVCLALILSPP